jgi:glucokinase
MSRILVGGDVGGTKSNLGLFVVEEDRPRLVRSANLVSADFPGLGALLTAFLAEDGGAAAVGVRAAAFGVPGPVADNFARTPNLAWEIDGDGLAAAAGIPVVRLVNDLVATAEGIPLLGSDDLAVLLPGAPAADGNRALLAAGTGLGMALLPRIGDGWVPVASEGGHMDFAPRDDFEIALLRRLRDRFGRVSVERVLSGPGLVQLYEHLAAERAGEVSPPVHARIMAAEDPAPEIAEAGLAGSCGLCAEALGRFAAAYGAVAGNLALAGTATGGVFLGGGIAPRILPRLLDGVFQEAFLAKGRFRDYLTAVPVRVILDDRIAMFGAARVAARLLPG